MKLVRNELFRSVEFKGKATELYYECIILILFLIIVWLVYFVLAPFAAILTSPTLFLFNKNERRQNQEKIENDKNNK
jgi:TM2 domain-containing membrane protein YozV